jgi:hypothetical protein
MGESENSWEKQETIYCAFFFLISHFICNLYQYIQQML